MTSKEDLMQQYRQMIEALQTENKNDQSIQIPLM